MKNEQETIKPPAMQVVKRALAFQQKTSRDTIMMVCQPH
jgi:hypothetical protein